MTNGSGPSRGERDGSPGQEPSGSGGSDGVEVPDRTLYDSLPDPAVVVAPEDWRIRVVNDAAAELLGRDREWLSGRPILELLPPSERDQYAKLLERTLDTSDDPTPRPPETDDVGSYVLHADGGVVPVDVSAGPVDLDGRSHVHVTFRDVSDRERRHETLERLHRANRRLLRVEIREEIAEIVSQVTDEVLDLPVNTVMLYDESADVLRRVASAPDDSEEFEPPKRLPRGTGVTWKGFERGEPLVYSDVREDPDVFNPDTPIRSEFVVPIGDHGVLVGSSPEADEFDPVDVSLAKTLASNAEAAFQRLESERELREQTRQLRTIVDNAPIVLFAHDSDGIFTVSEGKGLESLGLEPGEVVGESVFELYEGHDTIVDVTERALSGEPVHTTVEVGGKVFESWYHPITDEDGSVTEVIGASIEVTERERRERLVRVLNRFLRHNLRNAMNVIVGYAERLEGHEDPAVREGIDRIVATGEEVTRLSEKARRLSRLVARERDTDSVDVRTAVRNVVEDVESTYDAEITRRNLDGDPLFVDRTVELAVHEVVENAVKHVDGPDPRATVSVTERPERGQAVVHVVDDGPGLPEQERAVLEPVGETQLNHGSGLGLFVAYWALADAGGEIEVSEANDRGTAITMAAPVVERRE